MLYHSDDAQNTTSEQLSVSDAHRLRLEGRLTGDVTQIDLRRGSVRSDRASASRRRRGIEFIYFNDKDVVRHRLGSYC